MGIPTPTCSSSVRLRAKALETADATLRARAVNEPLHEVTSYLSHVLSGDEDTGVGFNRHEA